MVNFASNKKEFEQKIPKDLHEALKNKQQIETLWKNLTPIARRDFITWISSAKQQETRARRIKITLDKIASGKRRPCCYAIVPMHFYKALGSIPKAKATWSTLSPTEKRDFVAWVDGATEKEARRKRIEEACYMLATSKRHP